MKNEPLVYHLFGGDDPKYARYIVLAEDDYLKFLVNTPRHKGKPEIDLIPVRIRQAISNSTLLLLGFHLDDWDFKVLLHALLKLGGKELRGTGIAIQLSLGEDKYGNVDQVKRYIENYFDEENFSVYWGSTENFLEEIWG